MFWKHFSIREFNFLILKTFKGVERVWDRQGRNSSIPQGKSKDTNYVPIAMVMMVFCKNYALDIIYFINFPTLIRNWKAIWRENKLNLHHVLPLIH